MSYKIKQVEPDIGRTERKYVNDCLKRRWITEGKYADLFLDKIKKYTEAKYAVLAPSGTLALYMALYSIGVTKGDKVMVPDITFNATASILPFLGATPVFCDVNRKTFQMDAVCARELTEQFPIKAIVPVHLYGQSANMGSLMQLARDTNILVMEDAAQGLGVKYCMEGRYQHVGTMGKAGIFACYADKNVIMGEGGVIVTNDEETYLNLMYLRNQGRLKSGTFEHGKIGMNFRITDMQCAIGYAQMQRIMGICIDRIIKYAWYEMYMPPGVEMMKVDPKCIHIPLRCPILVDDKKKVIEHLEKNGIQTRELEYPLHRQPCWKHLRYESDAFPNANYLYEHGIKLPFHNRLRKKDVMYICQTIKKAIQ